MKGLKFFILSSNSSKLFRQMWKATSSLNEGQRQEIRKQIREQFMRSRHESDEDKIKYLLADGRKQLTYLKQLIDMNK